MRRQRGQAARRRLCQHRPEKVAADAQHSPGRSNRHLNVAGMSGSSGQRRHPHDLQRIRECAEESDHRFGRHTIQPESLEIVVGDIARDRHDPSPRKCRKPMLLSEAASGGHGRLAHRTAGIHPRRRRCEGGTPAAYRIIRRIDRSIRCSDYEGEQTGCGPNAQARGSRPPARRWTGILLRGAADGTNSSATAIGTPSLPSRPPPQRMGQVAANHDEARNERQGCPYPGPLSAQNPSSLLRPRVDQRSVPSDTASSLSPRVARWHSQAHSRTSRRS